ncbi:MarR family winged helix-turn-helix transcriptional regulator [Methylocystis sp. JR02]|uniref:MarR family winged helix-turn-helix transcriptional regulator n=1 Tax=Methylocystis sp. JR02 TaxID=3046284 RepID=UPI0024BADEAF|nr:MarR family winged helix-turn-helix transcriptional regulator [Methylocystis sp. JR02]MDJ0449012.1 MarR family winged helix-turn-helix transcriptional regulator [Methylocystis sp. JR02]
MTAPDPADVKACAQSCAAANVRRASRAVTRLYGQFMAETGLEPTQYSLLVACSLTGGATVSKLAEFFVMDRSALARNLAVMQKRGLVKVRPGEDRRTRKVALTPFGEATLANAMPHWREAQSAVEKQFGAERLQKLLSELRELMKASAEIGARD